MNPKLTNALKSLAWRTAMIALSFALGEAQSVLTATDLPQEFLVVVGLILGEISKYINKTYFPNEVQR